MTKQEQIDEMATAIMNYADKYAWGLIAFECENLAIVLHNLGYRKIDDDCAVITKDELKLYKRQAVKEFAERLKKDPRINNYGIEFVALVDIDAELKSLLKEYEE